MRAKLLQSCPTLCDPLDSSPPGSSVHGILQGRILEWVAISYSRGSSLPRDGTLPLMSPALAVRFFTTSTIREAHGINDAMNMNLVQIASGDSEGQGGPACFSPWGHKESDTTGQLNNGNISLVSIPTPPSLLLFVRAFQLISEFVHFSISPPPPLSPYDVVLSCFWMVNKGDNDLLDKGSRCRWINKMMDYVCPAKPSLSHLHT